MLYNKMESNMLIKLTLICDVWKSDYWSELCFKDIMDVTDITRKYEFSFHKDHSDKFIPTCIGINNDLLNEIINRLYLEYCEMLDFQAQIDEEKFICV